MTTTAGITMAGLVAIRSYTAGYIHMAEAFNWSFVTHEGEEDIIIGSRFGEEIIGAVILRLERSSGGGKKRKGYKNGGEALIRAWAVRIKYVVSFSFKMYWEQVCLQCGSVHCVYQADPHSFECVVS